MCCGDGNWYKCGYETAVVQWSEAENNRRRVLRVVVDAPEERISLMCQLELNV